MCSPLSDWKELIAFLKIDFREREGGGEGERNINVRVKHGLVASQMHPDGIEPANWACALTWNQTHHLWCMDDSPTNQATLARAELIAFF